MDIALGTIVKIIKAPESGELFAVAEDGKQIEGIPVVARRDAFANGVALKYTPMKSGSPLWKEIPLSQFVYLVVPVATTAIESSEFGPVPKTKEEIRNFLKDCIRLKPNTLKIDVVNWRATILAVLLGENIMFLGPAGCGKTLLATTMPKIFDREFFFFNMGATQDPRGTLIGNTHYDKEKGTYVAKALFAQAIQIPNAIILLDEMSRAHPEAHNILMTVLDQTQRYLRIDEDPESPTIKVAEGVCIMATANIGSQYVGTKTMDAALMDRFSLITMEPLGKEDELDLLVQMFPDLDGRAIAAIAEIADTTRKQVEEAMPAIETIVSTRMSVRMAAKMDMGISLADAAATEILPFYTNQGGEHSPRRYMKQLVQKYIEEPGKTNTPSPYNIKQLNPVGMKKPW